MQSAGESYFGTIVSKACPQSLQRYSKIGICVISPDQLSFDDPACTQSAMKTLVSPSLAPWRFDAQINFFPSFVNIGNPSNPSSKVICCSPVPSRLITNRSKLGLRGSRLLTFDAKIIWRPLG